MRVLFLSYWYNRSFSSPEDVLDAYPTLLGWAQALHAEGAEVTVLQRFHRDVTIQRNGVDYTMLRDTSDSKLRKWQIPWSLHRAARKLYMRTALDGEPTVVHLNGLLFPLQLKALRTILPSEATIVVQHHAEKPWQGIRRIVQKWGLRAADGFFFAASEMASSWTEKGLILSDQPVYQVMEGSTNFCRKDRAAARAETGLTGAPVVLWVGQLIAGKDPLTILRGFELILQQIPSARMYIVYGSDDLLPDVQEYIGGSPPLAKSVALLGRLPHSQLESIYNSADYFVLGSHYEGSGYSLVEALGCGVVPVVTDIPSFRAMTDGGKIGACWPPGDSAAFATAFVHVSRQPVEFLSDRAVQFFREHLSFPAIARKAITAYRELAAKKAARR